MIVSPAGGNTEPGTPPNSSPNCDLYMRHHSRAEAERPPALSSTP
jgi:hypothetical protein